MDDQEVNNILKRFQAGTCSSQELAQVHYWIHKFREDEISSLTEADFQAAETKMWTSINARTKPAKTNTISLRNTLAAAASVLIILSLSIYLYITSALHTKFANDIYPGTNKAVLVLSRGEKISLSEAKTGLLALQSTTKIIKTANGEIIYTSPPKPSPLPNGAGHREIDKEILNTIETPRGGQYTLLLPDGTKVWLNAASTLTYPVSFNGREERRIELSGEAYFEVAKDKLHPFLVHSKTQTVKVLGTHFNISSYPDEAKTRTTLLEGSVLVNKVALKPGQQAINSVSRIRIEPVDPAGVVAWKNGEFSFRNESLESIMRQLSRWYDVDIVYQNKEAGSQIFGGTISRFEKMSEVLHMLELTKDVKFKIEGRKITVL